MPLGLDPYARAILPESHWAALYTANAELVDWVLDDLLAAGQGTPVADLLIADYLPQVFRHRYDEAFLRAFLVCLVTVGLKLHLPGFHTPGCTAEELAAHVTRRRAADLLAEGGEVAEFDAWDDAVFEDRDHELLYDPALDGLADTAVARVLGAANLDYDDWFVPFHPPRLTHPYVYTDGPPPWELDRDHDAPAEPDEPAPG